MTIRLYHSPGSRSARVLWLLEELGCPYDLTTLTREERRADPHRTKHPLGKVPAIDTAGGTLYESGAICLQLADTHPEAGLIGPLGSQERALAYQWAFFNGTEIEPGVIEVLHHRENDPARAEAGRERFRPAAAVVETRLASHEWLVGDAFSVADVMIGDGLRLGRRADLLAGLPNIETYVARLDSRPAYVRSLALPTA